MKKIEVNGPVTLNCKQGALSFKRGEVYEVEDEVADHPYLKQYITVCTEVKEAKPARRKKKEAADDGDDGRALS